MTDDAKAASVRATKGKLIQSVELLLFRDVIDLATGGDI